MIRASSPIDKSGTRPLALVQSLACRLCLGQFFTQRIERLELAGDVSFGLLGVQVGQLPIPVQDLIAVKPEDFIF